MAAAAGVPEWVGVGMHHRRRVGGDWGLARVGAITIEGAEGVSITASTFTRLDGNAVLLSGYVRDVTVDSCEFVWLGESAVVRYRPRARPAAPSREYNGDHSPAIAVRTGVMG